MSDTEQRQRVNVGHTIRRKDETGDWLVLGTHDQGLLLCHGEGYYIASDVVFVRWVSILLPEPPKAKPGMRYRLANSGTSTRAIGLADGRLTYSGQQPGFEFNPAIWTEAFD